MSATTQGSSFVNLTPHSIRFVPPGQGRRRSRRGSFSPTSSPVPKSAGAVRLRLLDGRRLRRKSIASSGVARVQDGRTALGEHGGVPVVGVRPGDVVGLPDPTPGVVYIVSRPTAQAVVGRTDVLFPFDLVRRPTGEVIGAMRLARFLEGDSEDPE